MYWKCGWELTSTLFRIAQILPMHNHLFFSIFPPNQRKKNPLIFKTVPSICDNWYAILWTPFSTTLFVIYIYIYLVHLTLFHKSAIISPFPFANAFYIMILPQSIALYLIFWISVSIMWHDHFSVTSLTSLLQICTLLIIFLTLKSCAFTLLPNFAWTLLSPYIL